MTSKLKSTFNILFHLRATRVLKNGNVPILMRISVMSQRVEIGTQRDISAKLWSQSGECSKGKDAEAKILNHHLDTLRNKVIAIHTKMVEDGVSITASAIKDRFLASDSQNQAVTRTICGIYEEHNRKFWALVGKQYSKSTAEKFDTSLKCLREFILFEYKVKDLPLSEITGEFIRNFEFYLKSERNCQHNSAIKHLKNLKKVILIAINNEWMSKNPFINIPFRIDKVEKTALTQNQVQKIIEKQITNKRISVIRDIFLFCCYTGMAFADVIELKPEHIIEGNGYKLIVKKRQKTDQEFRVSIIEPAEEILNKYIVREKADNEETIFPKMSNQKMNSYLKEIADICDVDINLTTHVARHTFATLGLESGIPITTVQKNLGHSSLKTTSIYAKVTDKTIARDSQKLGKLFNKTASK